MGAVLLARQRFLCYAFLARRRSRKSRLSRLVFLPSSWKQIKAHKQVTPARADHLLQLAAAFATMQKEIQ
jgi:hypothetical protein